MKSTTELKAADEYCRYLASRHYENFSVASRLLAPHQRLHLARIYAFARTTDDLGDESGEYARTRLAVWREQTAAALEGGEAPIHPVLISLKHSVAEFALPAQPFIDLISANEQDQQIKEYETWDQLIDYCYRSAAPVGRLVLRVFGAHSDIAERLSDDVCIGLQLANFAQDVKVDREKGRRYLVGVDVQKLGLTGAVASMCGRAGELLQSGRELETMVSGRLRMQLSLYRMGGEAILDAVERIDYHTDQRRPQVKASTKGLLVVRALTELGRRRGYAATQPNV